MSQQQAESNRIKSLLDGLQRENPRLYQALIAMQKDISQLYIELHPITSATAPLVDAASTPPPTPDVFSYTFGLFTVNFVWTSVTTAQFYELREGGTGWDDATFVVKTPSNGASVDALLEGAHTYRLKSINVADKYSETCIDVVVTVTETAAPSLSATVIDNNVLLYWTVPTSIFQIDHYNLYRDTVKFAEITGTFLSRYETLSGTFTYSVIAVDVAGNESAEGSYITYVNQPPDFNLLDSRVVDLSAATLVNAVYVSGTSAVLACIDLTETYEDHFINGTWATPQEQVDDSYDVFIEEGLLTGSALEEYDYGTILSNVIVTVQYDSYTIPTTSDVTVTVKLDVSDDGSTWAGETSGSSQYFVSVRYLRVKLEFSAADADRLIEVSNVRVVLNVKREVDSNDIACLATDSGGTEVELPGDPTAGHGVKTFKDIDSITVSPITTEPITPIVDFTDIPNPTSFKILVFDAAGRRVDGVVSWKARGIV